MARRRIYIDIDLIKHPVLNTLSRVSLVVYLHFMRKIKVQPHTTTRGKKKVTDWIRVNDGKIQFTYREAEKLGISSKQFCKAIDELIEKGLIDLTTQGHGGWQRTPNLYAISERWRDWDTPKFKKMERKKDKRQGKGWAYYHKIKKQK